MIFTRPPFGLASRWIFFEKALTVIIQKNKLVNNKPKKIFSGNNVRRLPKWWMNLMSILPLLLIWVAIMLCSINLID